MAKVESNLQMFAVLQEKQSLNKYYKLFTAQMEVIKANGGRAGHNPELYHEHLLKVIAAKGYTRTEYRGPEERPGARGDPGGDDEGRLQRVPCPSVLAERGPGAVQRDSEAASV